ncbi:MAG: mannuronan 5-epimerase, partial [Frankiaceae bacterium]|nr:mannuronan 5-epimerase [Frankiaceae bacterium]
MRLSRPTVADGLRRLFAASLATLAMTATAGLGVAALESGADASMASPMPPSALSIPDTSYAVPAGAIVVSPSGNDAAAGTLAAPFRTVAHAVAAVPAGGVVVLRGGDYREALGSINKPFTLQSYPHEQAWLKGSALVTGWTPSPAATQSPSATQSPAATQGYQAGSVWKHTGWTNQFCRTCVNPQAVNPANPLAGWPDQVFVNGAPLNQVDSPAKVTPGTFNIDYATQTITVGTDPTGKKVESSDRWNAMTVNSAAAGLTLRGIGIAQYAPNWNENQLGALVVAANNVTLENSAVVFNTGRGAQFNSPGGHIIGSRFNSNGYSGLGTNRAHGLVVSRNQIDGNNWRHFATSGCGMYCTVAGYKAAHTANSTVSDNTVRNNVGTGYWCDLGCNNTTIVRNYVENNSNKGIFYEVSTTGLIASNVFRSNTVGLELAGSDRTTIYNNTFDRNGTHLQLFDDTRLASSDSYSGGLGLSWNTTGNTLRNNLFGATTGGVAVDTNATSQVNAGQMLVGMDHNAYYRTSASAPLVHWCPTYPSVPAFAAASGFDGGSGDAVGPANPYLLNAVDGRFELAPPSPL